MKEMMNKVFFYEGFDAMFIVDYHTLTIAACNKKSVQMCEMYEGELIGKHIEALFGNIIEDIMEMGVQENNEKYTLYCKEFKGRWIDLHFKKISIEDKKYIIIQCIDRDEHKKLEYMAYHDALTNLPNRRCAEERLKSAIKRASKNNTQMAILFVDLDNFKYINDTFGHAVGDEILKGIGSRIKNSIREEDVVSRYGGDEFIVILDKIFEHDHVRQVVERLMDAFLNSFKVEEKELNTTCSIGVAVFPQDGRDIDSLLKHADVGMYKAKSSRKNTYRIICT
ncbi:sensor domain-containing diguanylate cyclase [Lutibacter sp. B2]|nr:sensor domain-containing diguanylate cyclase [Lutibacter sp. B2]